MSIAKTAASAVFALTAFTAAAASAQGGAALTKVDQQDRDHPSVPDYAFPQERKEPLGDARHVRNAVARFNQVKGVTDGERDEAWERITAAARKFGVQLRQSNWRDLNKPKG